MISSSWHSVKESGKTFVSALVFLCTVTLTLPLSIEAQAETPEAGSTVRVDSVEVSGNSRVQSQLITQLFAIQAGQQITYRAVQRGTKELLATGQFDV
ncbi:MAG TPA: hypothetical protein DEB33_01045, partial [Gemmatimonadetes bacterium]|nr:hypothetical protein [Gemmatimonadota bacterium]